MELQLDYYVALLVDGLKEALQPGDIMIFGYGARAARDGDEQRVFLGQPCIEKETDALTPEQMKQHASEVDASCL